MTYSDVTITPRSKNDGTQRIEYVVVVEGTGYQDAIEAGTYDSLLDIERDAFRRPVLPEKMKEILDTLRDGRPSKFNLEEVLGLPQ